MWIISMFTEQVIEATNLLKFGLHKDLLVECGAKLNDLYTEKHEL